MFLGNCRLAEQVLTTFLIFGKIPASTMCPTNVLIFYFEISSVNTLWWILCKFNFLQSYRWMKTKKWSHCVSLSGCHLSFLKTHISLTDPRMFGINIESEVWRKGVLTPLCTMNYRDDKMHNTVGPPRILLHKKNQEGIFVDILYI